MKITNKNLRKEIFTADSQLSDRSLFSSRAYGEYLQSLVNFFCRQLGRPIKLQMVPDEEGDMTACTNGNEIIDNPFGPLVRNLPRKYHFLAEVGKICHEACHCLFTDFPVLHRYLDSFEDSMKHEQMEWYPLRPEDRKKFTPDKRGLKAIEEAAGNKRAAYFVMNVAQQTSNIIDDPYIESRGLSYFGGLFAAGITYIARQTFEKSSTVEETAEEGGLLAAAMSSLLLEVRGFGPKYGPNPTEATDAVAEFIEDIQPEVLLLKTEKNYTVRCELMNSVLTKIARFFPFFPEEEKQDDESGGEGKSGESDDSSNSGQSGNSQGESKNSSGGNGQSRSSGNSSKSSGGGESGDESNDSSDNGSSSGDNGESSDTNGGSPIGSANSGDDASGGKPSGKGASASSGNHRSGKGSGKSNPQKGMSPAELLEAMEKMAEAVKQAGGTNTARGNTTPVDAPETHKPEEAKAAAENLINNESDRLFDEMRNEIVEQLARNSLEAERNSEESKEVNALSKEVFNADNKYGFHAVPQHKEEYLQSYEGVKSIADKTFKRINTILKERKAEGTVHGFYNGKVTSHRLYRQDMRVFDRKMIPTGDPKLAVSLLIDESGSMYGPKQEMAAQTAIVLEDVMRRLHVPCMVVGHSDNYGRCELNEYVAFDSYKENQRFTLGQTAAGGRTNDAAGISYCAEKLLKSNEERKLLIVISDGCPNVSTKRFSCDSLEDTIATVQYYQKKGVKVIGIAIDGNMDYMSKIYGNSMLKVTDWNTLPVEMSKIIRKEVLDRGY